MARMGLVRIDRRMLGKILLLPDEIVVAAVSFDPCIDAILLRVEGELLPLVRDCQQLQMFTPCYRWRKADAGESIVELDYSSISEIVQ